MYIYQFYQKTSLRLISQRGSYNSYRVMKLQVIILLCGSIIR